MDPDLKDALMVGLVFIGLFVLFVLAIMGLVLLGHYLGLQ